MVSKAGKKKPTRKAVNTAASKATKKAAKKAVKKTAEKAARKGSLGDLLARGGGAGPAAGVTFQGLIGGLFAATGLSQDPVDQRLQLEAESG